MTPDEKFEKELESAAQEFTDKAICRRLKIDTDNITSDQYCAPVFWSDDVVSTFENGAKFGREFGRREAIEALRSVNIMSAAVYSKTSDRPLIDNRQWADWLEDHFQIFNGTRGKIQPEMPTIKEKE